MNFNTLGTAAAYSGPLIFSRLGIDIDKTFIPHPVALQQMRKGDMAAGRRRRRAAQLMIPERHPPQESMMTKFEHVMRAAVCTFAVCLAALFLVAPPAAAQGKELASTPTAPGAANKAHRLIVQVNTNEPAMMNLAVNNATNVAQYYKTLGETVEIEVVTFGPGLHMLRDDTSPVKDRIKAIAEKMPSISFKACGNTQENKHKAENKEIPLVSQATLVKSGVVRVMELQEQGWSYVRP